MPTNDPRKKEQLTGAISVWSNSYGTATGYGVQTTHLVDRLKRHGADVAMLSNYGLEGRFDEIKTKFGTVPHFPRGFDAYSNDVAPNDHLAWAARNPDKPSLMITLYDAWVLKSPRYAEVPKIASWTPIDHVTLPPKVEEWLVRPNVTPIAMAPNGQRILNEKGIDHVYIPHAVDTAVFKPVEKMPSGQAVTDYFGSSERFVVGMVAANKASGMVHRKSFSENLMAFSIFKKRHPEALLYLHTEPIGMMGGWNLLELLKALGISPQDVMFPNPHDQRFGVSDETMAALYSGIDVLLAPSMGEGFGVPTIEAQACGTRVIVSSWAASQDLASKDSWLVEGQPVWDNMQNAWWMTPQIPSIVEALEQALQAGKTRSMDARKFAKGFDVEKVWFDNWMPALRNWLQH